MQNQKTVDIFKLYLVYFINTAVYSHLLWFHTISTKLAHTLYNREQQLDKRAQFLTNPRI